MFFLAGNRMITVAFEKEVFLKSLACLAKRFSSTEVNRFAKQAKILKKNLFFKSDGGHAISRQEKHQLPTSKYL